MSATPFITIDEVKAWKDPGGSITDVSENTNIELVIDAVCTDMEQYMRRPVVARHLTKVSDGGCTRILLAHQNPGYFSVSSVVEDGTPLTLDTDYKVYTAEGYVARVQGEAFAKFTEKPQAVTISYEAGVAETVDDVPKLLKMCAIIATRFYLALGPDNFGKRFEGGSVMMTDAFPRQCRWIMDKYRLHTGGAT